MTINEFDHPDHGYKWRKCEIDWIEQKIKEAVEREREACAKVAEAAAEKFGNLGRLHRDEGHTDSMDRCYARALQCTQLAAEIRTRHNDRGVGPDAASCGRSHTTDGLCPDD